MRSGPAAILGLLLGAGVASAVWAAKWENAIGETRDEAAAKIPSRGPSVVWLLNRGNCEREMISCDGVEDAMASGLYWAPGTTVKECAAPAAPGVWCSNGRGSIQCFRDQSECVASDVAAGLKPDLAELHCYQADLNRRVGG